MTVLIGTGNAMLDAHLLENIPNSKKVSYLEEIIDTLPEIGENGIVLVSAYLPSVQDDTEKEKLAAFEITIHQTLGHDSRIVFLADYSFPLDLLKHYVGFGVFDFIISEDGNVDLQSIAKCLNHPASKEDAFSLITALEKQRNPKNSPLDRIMPTAQQQSYAGEESFETKPQNGFTAGPAFQEPLPNHSSNGDVLSRLTTPQNFNQVAKGSRKRATDKPEVKSVEDAKIFSFWADSTNQGKRTLSQSFAIQIARMGYSVLYVEFDHVKPTFALTTALSNPDKNFFQLSLSQESFRLDDFIANKMDVRTTKEFYSLYEEIPEELYFLGLPQDYIPETFPTITNQYFLNTLLGAFEDAEFDAVVLSLPNAIDDLFTFPVMLQSDVVFGVTTANPVRINEFRKSLEELTATSLDMNKLEIIFNQVGYEIKKEVCDHMLNQTSLALVPYDVQRASFELDLRMGSNIINQKMNELAANYGFVPPQEVQPKKKGLKGFFK